jgi:hypothetical protein
MKNIHHHIAAWSVIIPPLQNEATGEFVVNDEDKANLLNTFFCSISEIIDSDLPTPVFDKRTGRKFDVFNITIDEIKDVHIFKNHTFKHFTNTT